MGPLRNGLLGDAARIDSPGTGQAGGWSRLLDGLLRRYADGEAAAVAPHIVGRRVLDLGGGEGHVAAALRRRTGAWVCAADIGPYRRAEVPFVCYDGLRLPFPAATFDTTLLLLTLHHCSRPDGVLDEALRVTRHRLLVTESVFRNRRDRFWLERLDGRVNRWRHGGAMPVPLAFRSPADWQTLFASRGLRIRETRWLGAWWERLVHHPLLFVLDAAAGVGSGTATR